MRREAALYAPFHKYFKLTVLHTVPTKRLADAIEEIVIKENNAQGSTGANILSGPPGRSPAFWWMLRRGKLKKARATSA